MALGIVCRIALAKADQPDAVPFKIRVPPLESELAERIARADAEIEKLGVDHPWAGAYEFSELGCNVKMWLAPKEGCVAEWRGCLGLYGVNWGPVKESNGDLVITFERSNSLDDEVIFPTRLDISCVQGWQSARPRDPSWTHGLLTKTTER
jgi:hypothetical protein